jgi:hypothetical protein
MKIKQSILINKKLLNLINLEVCQAFTTRNVIYPMSNCNKHLYETNLMVNLFYHNERGNNCLDVSTSFQHYLSHNSAK